MNNGEIYKVNSLEDKESTDLWKNTLKFEKHVKIHTYNQKIIDKVL